MHGPKIVSLLYFLAPRKCKFSLSCHVVDVPFLPLYAATLLLFKLVASNPAQVAT